MASQKSWLFYTAFLCANRFVLGGDTYSEEMALITVLQTNYSTDIRPSTPTYINVFYALRTIQELDITEQTITTGGWISVYWTDPRLVWNASDYANISELDVNWAWRPVFMISNSADDYYYGGFRNDNILTRVFSDGTVRWVLPLHLTTNCDVSIARFPYDSQSCYIDFVFLGLNGIDVVANVTRELALAAYLPSHEWQYDDGYLDFGSPVATCCPPTDYQMMYVHVRLTRLRPFYVINLVIPSVALSFCMALVFLLPTDSGERLGYSLTIFLSFTVVMTITSGLMPTTSKEIPIIAIYILLLFLLCATSNFNVVINVKMYHLQSEPPKWLQKLALKLRPITVLKCKQKDKVRPVSTSNKSEERITCTDISLQSEKDRIGFDEESRSSSNDNESVTWQQVAEISDRLCLYFYTVAVVLCLFFFSLALDGSFTES